MSAPPPEPRPEDFEDPFEFKAARATWQRARNDEAKAAGQPLPYPNPFDRWDPTKVGPDATEAELMASLEAFQRICRRREIRHTF
ncbi:MAG: hypothetical protein KC613_28090 [Myxococcales bacterium]|nr:hypothetical protein [Myxococcales bacterium]MCB9524490.1 hypothetical protein [Myxococcales bacterium]